MFTIYSGIAPRIKDTDFDFLPPGLIRGKQSSHTTMNKMKQLVISDPVKAKVRIVFVHHEVLEHF